MTEFVYFLGRFHVLLLHLPIGILLLAVVAEVLARRERFRQLEATAGFLWAAGAISAVLTVALGYMHATESGFEGSSLDGHRFAGTSLAVLACLVWLLRGKLPNLYGKAWPVFSAATIALLFVTGHFGGNLTHGETYLVQYAPGPLRQLAGVATPRAKPQSLAAADIYLDVVAPALEQRCATCHNESKRKGGLSVASHADLMKGGENGAVVVAGDRDKSDLFRRITLAHDDEEFMPKDGKTPLTAEQTAAIGWWISVGAPQTASISTLQLTHDVQPALETILGLRAPAPAEAKVAEAARSVPNLPPPDPAVVNEIEGAGFVVRSVTADSPMVDVDFTAQRDITTADVEKLAKIGQQVNSLNLRDSGVTDEHLKTVGRFANLTRLRLELNPITNTGLAQLASLKNLEYLNIYGSKVTDAGLAVLASLEHLREMYVWQTGVSAAGLAQLKSAHPNIAVDGGFDTKRFPVGPKEIPVVN
jgi:uncharacterized membrane protein